MKVLSIFKYVFSAVGIALLVGAFMSYKSSSEFLEEAVSTHGMVVEMTKSRSSDSISFYPVVEFAANDGQKFEFTSNVGSNPPSYSLGETVEVLYLPTNPQEAKLNYFSDLWAATVVMLVMGVPFLSVGIIIFLIGRLKNRKKDYLTRSGVVVDAQVQSVEPNHRLSINGRNPFVIVCHWLNPATSEVHVFESENIWFDPSNYMQDEKIKVFIKQGNPKKYYVDVSFLPKIAR